MSMQAQSLQTKASPFKTAQSIWNPTAIFDEVPDLRLTPTEVKGIQEKLPVAPDGCYYADAVFEGGGVKGTAFLGALRCFNDAGIQFRKVAGTSAGAITAAMVAAGFSIEQLEAIMADLDYMKDLLNKKSSFWIWNGSPADDLQGFQMIKMLMNLLLVRRKGQYSSEPFKTWLSKHLAKRDMVNFSALSQEKSTEWYHKRDLKVVVSDISQKAMRVLPHDLKEHYGEEPESFEIAEAVRLSMSIPLFFEPGKLGQSIIVDGGLLSNFPLWIFDAPLGVKPKCPTFGFQLTEAENSKPITGAHHVFGSMIATMQVARDKHYLHQTDKGRVVNIDTGTISATKFDLDTVDKQTLYLAGYEAAKDFLVNRWDWEAHLQERQGVNREAVGAAQSIS